MGSPNGGIIGVINPTSFGKCTVTSKTSSGSSYHYNQVQLLLNQQLLLVQVVQELVVRQVEEVELVVY
jgi:hypothetical protein